MSIQKNTTEKQLLEALLAQELAKPSDEMDADLVSECNEMLAELAGYDPQLPQEEIERRVKAIPFKPKKKGVRKRIVLIAATLALLAVLTNLAAYGLGYTESNFVLYIRDLFDRLTYSGQVIDENGFTVIKHGTTTRFASLDEFLAKEQYDIFVPQNIMDTMDITSVIISNTGGIEKISVVFNDEYTEMQIEIGQAVTEENRKNANRIIEKDDIIFYVFEDTDTSFAIWEYGGNYHSLTVRDKSISVDEIL